VNQEGGAIPFFSGMRLNWILGVNWWPSKKCLLNWMNKLMT
jgi:hypothetical protein